MKIELNQLNASWRFRRENLPAAEAAGLTCDDRDWEQITLPHSAHIEPEICNRPWFGRCWYRLKLRPQPEWKNRIIALEIDAAMQKTEVYINGKFVSTHSGGYRRFRIPLTDELDYSGGNVVALCVDNRESPDFPPGKPYDGLDFCYYSGLYRSARLIIDEPMHISDPVAVPMEAGGGVFIRTLQANDAEATLEFQIHALHEVTFEQRWQGPSHLGQSHPCRLSGTLYSPGGAAVAQFESDTVELPPNTGHTFSLRRTVPAPELWSPGSPSLYRVELKLHAGERVCDEVTLRYGIRTLLFCARRGFVLNGTPVRLIGTNRHQDYPYVGNAVPPAAQRRDAAIIKAAGYNLVRLSHYNQHPAFLDACDEMGICVVAAIPGWQYYNLSDSFVNHACRDCRELVRNERNRPSVILWEVSLNESYPPGWLNEEFHRIAHREYPGDQCYTCGDTFGLYEGWDVLFSRQDLKTDKPVLVREYGDWSFGGNESTSRRRRGDGDRGMLQQAWNFQWMLNQLALQPNVIGGATWAMFDYNRGYHHDLERSGDADLYRVPRYKYHFYRSQACPEPMIFIANSWNKPEAGGKVVVFSNCDEVELLRNGRSVARRLPDNGPTTAYNRIKEGSPSWETALSGGADGSGGNPFDGGNCEFLAHPPFTFPDIGYEPGELKAVGFRNGVKTAEAVVRTPGTAARLTLTIRTENVPLATPDLIFADVALCDASGTVLCDAALPVTLEATGSAKVTGDSAKPLEAGLCTFLVAIADLGNFTLTARCDGFRDRIEM